MPAKGPTALVHVCTCHVACLSQVHLPASYRGDLSSAAIRSAQAGLCLQNLPTVFYCGLAGNKGTFYRRIVFGVYPLFLAKNQ